MCVSANGLINVMSVFTTVILLFDIRKCSANLSFLNDIKRLIWKDNKDKDIKGSFKTLMYLGAVAKISCSGKKYISIKISNFSWYHSGKLISNNKHYTIDRQGILAVHGVSAEDSGEFICWIKLKSGTYKFKHDVSVHQFPSKSLHIHFIYAVRECTAESEEFANHFIETKVRKKVCLKGECEIGFVHGVCRFEEFANPTLKVTVPILLPGVPKNSCNIECLRGRLEVLKEEVKQKVISAVMNGSRLKIREEPKEMSISYLETEEDNICYPGFEMKGPVSRSICIPCPPGQFMEKGYCIPCHLNYYNGKYAATECRPCFGNRVTRNRGSVSEEHCYLADPDVFWILFVIFIIVVPFILICCYWEIIKIFSESSLVKWFSNLCNCKLFEKKKSEIIDEESFKLSKYQPKSRSKPKFMQGKMKDAKPPYITSSKNKSSTSDSDSTFAIPSIRHSTGRHFFYKPKKSTVKNALPPRPALPTDSMLKQAAKNMNNNAGVRRNQDTIESDVSWSKADGRANLPKKTRAFPGVNTHASYYLYGPNLKNKHIPTSPLKKKI